MLFIYPDAKKFNFKTNWFYYLEKELFEQTHNITDEYERVRNLNYLSKIFDIYTEEERKDLIQIFKSEDALMDLYKITEGYLILKDSEKFDEFVELNRNNYKNFRAFNGRDKVSFSVDFVVLKTLELSENFEIFLRARMFGSRTSLSRENSSNMLLFLNDKKAGKKLAFFNNIEFQNLSEKRKKELEEKSAEYQAIIDARDIPKIQDIIIKAMVLYFKIVITRTLLNKYTYIASGIYVSKIADYALRMIVETYDSKALLNIAKNRNDGSSDSFESDTLVNLFLYSYNVFCYDRKVKILDEINRNLNTDTSVITSDMEVDKFMRNVG